MPYIIQNLKMRSNKTELLQSFKQNACDLLTKEVWRVPFPLCVPAILAFLQ